MDDTFAVMDGDDVEEAADEEVNAALYEVTRRAIDKRHRIRGQVLFSPFSLARSLWDNWGKCRVCKTRKWRIPSQSSSPTKTRRRNSMSCEHAWPKSAREERKKSLRSAEHQRLPHPPRDFSFGRKETRGAAAVAATVASPWKSPTSTGVMRSVDIAGVAKGRPKKKLTPGKVDKAQTAPGRCW